MKGIAMYRQYWNVQESMVEERISEACRGSNGGERTETEATAYKRKVLQWKGSSGTQLRATEWFPEDTSAKQCTGLAVKESRGQQGKPNECRGLYFNGSRGSAGMGEQRIGAIWKVSAG